MSKGGTPSPLGGLGRGSSLGKTSKCFHLTNTDLLCSNIHLRYTLTSRETRVENVCTDAFWLFFFSFFSMTCYFHSALCACRYSVQPKLYRVVRGPGHSDEGHPGSSENEGADPEGTAATSPAGHGGKAVCPHFSGPQQLQS